MLTNFTKNHHCTITMRINKLLDLLDRARQCFFFLNISVPDSITLSLNFFNRCIGWIKAGFLFDQDLKGQNLIRKISINKSIKNAKIQIIVLRQTYICKT